jgi:GAF domain-containing protein
MSDEGEKQDAIDLGPVLEAPPEGDSPTAGHGGSVGLFDDSIASTAGKLAIAEGCLKAITRDQAFPDFTRELLLLFMKVVKCEAGSLFELDQSRNALFFRSVVGTSSDRLGNFSVPIGQGIVGHVAESRRPLVVDNVPENHIHLKAIQDAVGFEARNMVALPIIIRGRLYGVLELLNRVGETGFSAFDMEILSYACEMAGKAIEARLMIAWGAKSRQASGSSSHGDAA